MKKKQRLRLFIIRLTAIMFAAYSAFYIFVLIRDLKQASLQELLIEALVSLLFALLSAFAWTSEVSDLKFIRVRRIVFIIALLAVVLLKLRLTGSVIAFLDFTGENRLLFALYGAAFFYVADGAYHTACLLHIHPQKYAALSKVVRDFADIRYDIIHTELCRGDIALCNIPFRG